MSAVGEQRTGRPVEGSAARLDLHHDPSVRTILDGVWRPRSWDTANELAELIAALDASKNRVSLIMLNPAGWQGHPRKVAVAGRVVRVAWFVDLDASVLIATTNSYQRIDLLVRVTQAPIGPVSPSPVEVPAVAVAGIGSPAEAEAVWESEGGWGHADPG